MEDNRHDDEERGDNGDGGEERKDNRGDDQESEDNRDGDEEREDSWPCTARECTSKRRRQRTVQHITYLACS